MYLITFESAKILYNLSSTLQHHIELNQEISCLFLNMIKQVCFFFSYSASAYISGELGFQIMSDLFLPFVIMKARFLFIFWFL